MREVSKAERAALHASQDGKDLVYVAALRFADAYERARIKRSASEIERFGADYQHDFQALIQQVWNLGDGER